MRVLAPAQPHAGARAIGAHVVVKLRGRGQHAFHQLVGGGVVAVTKELAAVKLLAEAIG